MGIEAFGVSIDFVESGIYEQVLTVLSAYRHVQMHREEHTTPFVTIPGEYNDESHIIELQLRRDTSQSTCTLAVRFSLCSYDTIDRIFIELVSKVLSSWDANVWLMTSALREKDHYPPGEANWLLTALPGEITAMRKYWQSRFGHKQGAVRVKDSFSFVGLNVT
jgi:hypothetical protein